jgi:hypothetical protein
MAESPPLLTTNGLPVTVTRLIVFCSSAFFAGVAGALAVTQFGAASGVAYGPIQSMLFLAVLAICGTQVVRSSVLAAALVAVVPGYITNFSVDRQTFAFGVVAVAAGVVIAARADIVSFFARPSDNPRPMARSPRPVPRREHVRLPVAHQRITSPPRPESGSRGTAHRSATGAGSAREV